MRAPFQILVLPFRLTATEPEFAVLKRRDDDNWQFVAGGGEDNETPLQAARRETQEEIGLAGEMIKLDSISTVPKNCFAAADSWGPAEDAEPGLSSEHTEIKWLPYQQAYEILKWDSNRNALWELNERLKN
jgi:dATP pyrophosphohydrolase